MMSKEGFFFMIMPSGGVFGDFNVSFDTKTLLSLRGAPIQKWQKHSIDKEIFTCRTMNCPKEVFQDLMELYEETAENIKIRSLEKREVFMYYLQKERHRQMKRLGVEIGREDQVKFDKWLNQSTYENTESDEDPYHITKPFENDKLSPGEFLKVSSHFSPDETEGKDDEYESEDADRL